MSITFNRLLCLFFLTLSSPLWAEESPSPEEQLFQAIISGDLEAVQYCADQDADLNEQLGEHGDTPLICAVKCLFILKYNFEKKVFSDPYTFNTAYANRLSIIKFLAFHPEVECKVKNYRDESALSIATQFGLDAVTEILVSRFQLNSLNSPSDDMEFYQELLEELDITEETRQQIQEAIEKSATASSHETGKHTEYLKFIFALPWDKQSEALQSLPDLASELEKNHYGLQKVKDKILEHLALTFLRPTSKAKRILCLVGPPGTGKTSIAQSIAQGLNKDFAKVSLGGIHDERAIRGHNKAYVGAEPGDILKALKKAGTKNAVIVLDEIDKMGDGYCNGSPASALLEVLDPEQNSAFVDHYLDIEFDLSDVFFITTANTIDTIPAPLLDRMDVIKLTSYTYEEKTNIAKKHLLPKVLAESGLDEKGLVISDEVIRALIDRYTYESGVRKLEQSLKTLCAKAARLFLETETIPTFSPENLDEYLGAGRDRPLEKEFTEANNIGVSNGLYWSSVQGGILFFETSIMPGKGELKLTGQQGDVCKESATLALSYIRSHAQELDITDINFSAIDIHIHVVPSSGVEGPSAGTALLSSIVSALTKKPFNASYAMTGELSLTGHVLPIGGLKEKLLAAKKRGVKNVLIPHHNYEDLKELNDITDTMNITMVSHAHEVLEKVLLPF